MPGARVRGHPDLLGSPVTIHDELDAIGELEREDVVGQLYFERFAQTLAQVIELREQLRQRLGGLLAIGLFSEGFHRHSCRMPNPERALAPALG